MGMEFGVTFPQTDIETDPEALRIFAETVEEIGYEHILAYDHILGVKPPEPNWNGAYDYTDQFLEPLLLFSNLASVTSDVDFLTGILVLPQRETALVAKQAATLDVLSNGRIRLGIGVGWNDLEYDNLGFDFATRGARIEEQIDMLCALWRDELVNYSGDWHEIRNAGINPRPTDGSIPIWLGGSADAVLRRMANKGDGWIAPTVALPEFEAKVQKLRQYLRAEGRDADAFPIHARVTAAREDDEWDERLARYSDLGVSHVSVGTMNMGYVTANEHLEALAAFMNELQVRGYA